MSILNALILGLIRGIAGVLPVSSSGLSALAGKVMGIDLKADPLFTTWIGAGVLIAIAVFWRKEIAKLLTALGGMVMDIAANLLILILAKNSKYRRIVYTSYRKMTVMLLISLIPSVIINCLFGDYAWGLYGNLLPSCIGMLLTAMLLMVASFAGKQAAGPKDSTLFSAAITGVFHGFSVFPGVSGVGMAYAGGRISEFTARFTAIYVFLLYFLTGLIRTAAGFVRNVAAGARTDVPCCMIGTAAAAVSAYIVLNYFRKRFKASGSIRFALIGACAGVVMLIVYFAG